MFVRVLLLYMRQPVTDLPEKRAKGTKLLLSKSKNPCFNNVDCVLRWQLNSRQTLVFNDSSTDVLIESDMHQKDHQCKRPDIV